MLVIEPLNTLKDHKNYYLDNFQKTLELIQSINSEHLKILYDIYHMQIMEGNVLETLQIKELSEVYSGFVGFEFFVKEKSFTYKKLYEWVQSNNL